jgi:mono/diheme cytochrome c family protein
MNRETIQRGSAICAGTFALWMVLSPGAIAQSFTRDLIAPNGVKRILTLPQNWTDDEARQFYTVPQGSSVLPYRWFLFLEQPAADAPFRDARFIQSLGYLPRSPDEHGNTDGLPIGFVKDGDQLGLTCAACHTGLLRRGDTAWLIDGAPTAGDFEKLFRGLSTSLRRTVDEPARFRRFADSVLGGGDGDADRNELMQKLKAAADTRERYNARNLPRAGAPSYGPGRLDAFGAIINEVGTTFAGLPDENAKACDAPVSYPFLWDTPHHDFVQWNGAAPNVKSSAFLLQFHTSEIGALGRNVGEVLGVFGSIDPSKAPAGGILGISGYPASARKLNLIDIEDLVRKLWSPQWPAELGIIDENDRVKGQTLFKQNCATCHDDTFKRTSAIRSIEAKISDVGTDQQMAKNFATRTLKTGQLKGRLVFFPGLRRFDETAPARDMLSHLVQRAILGPQPRLLDVAEFGLGSQRYLVHAELRLDDTHQLIGAFDNLDLVAGKVKSARNLGALTLRKGANLLMQDISSLESTGKTFVGNGDLVDLANLAGTQIRAAVGGSLEIFDQPVDVVFRYKARPLNGVWATAPYLHNGSVPNLDELLKPAVKRTPTFRIGSQEFDADKVGFKTDVGFELDTTTSGNKNTGHEYGNREFSPDERRQLIAYVKSL